MISVNNCVSTRRVLITATAMKASNSATRRTAEVHRPDYICVCVGALLQLLLTTGNDSVPTIVINHRISLPNFVQFKPSIESNRRGRSGPRSVRHFKLH